MNEARRRRGAKARRDGRWAETLCGLWLMLKGYRILGFRLKTPQAEIDILARKGETLAVIEIKRRRTLEAARAAVSYDQRRRLIRAARQIAGREHSSIRLDLIALAPGRFPCHIRDAWRDE